MHCIVASSVLLYLMWCTRNLFIKLSSRGQSLEYLQQTSYPTIYLTHYFKFHFANSANSTLHNRLHGLLNMAFRYKVLYIGDNLLVAKYLALASSCFLQRRSSNVYAGHVSRQQQYRFYAKGVSTPKGTCHLSNFRIFLSVLFKKN